MSQLISEIWEGLCSAGLTEVMLYLPDDSAARCHWRDTAVIAGVRVALIADQERKIVRIVPVDTCAGIGIASPKGVDPTGHRSVVLNKIVGQFPQPPDPFKTVEKQPEPEPIAPEPVVEQPAVPEPPPSVEAAEATTPPPPSAPPSATGRLGAMTRNLEARTATPVTAAGQGISRSGERGWNRA